MATEAGEQILRALHERRSVPRVRPERPPRELIERVLEAAVQAPNHYRTEPWRFFVLAGQEREHLGQVMVESLRAELDEPGSEDGQAALQKVRAKPMRAPVLIVVAVVPSDIPKVVEIEEVAAGAAAVQNILLAAEAVGLGAMWRTGAPAYDPAVKRFFGLPDSAHILAFVYLGYPDSPPSGERRRDVDGHTTWMGWDDEV